MEFPWTRFIRQFGRSTQWLDSTLQAARWLRERRAGIRWSVAGALLGTLIGVIAFAPATWLAAAVSSSTGGRVQLAQANGTVWSGSALTVLTAGAGSRDARVLPDRLAWSIRLRGLGFQVDLQQACCLNQTVSIVLKPGLGRLQASILGSQGWIAQWPAAVLSGLGTPWNTLDLGGSVRLSTRDFALDWVQGRVRIRGSAEVRLMNVSSRLTTLERLGSYALTISGNADKAGAAELALSTTEGALLLSGQGSVGPQGLNFRGEARAAEGQQAALNNLLNIIGRRDGARSVIAIG